MRLHPWLRSGLSSIVTAALLAAQAPPIMVLPDSPKPEQQQPAPPPAKPGEAPKAEQAPAAAPPKLSTQGTLTESGGFLLQNVSLVDMIDILAKRMKINYILDPRVKGNVTINTHGEVRPTDLMQLMQTILRINGNTMVQVGDLYRIVPLAAAKQLPISPTVNGKNMADDERMVLNLVFLKYATAEEMAKLLQPFLGEGAEITTYPAANLLIILDNTRNMKRTMDLLSMFDSDTLAGQRVRLFEVSHGKPSDLAKELETIFKAYALSEKNAGVRFLPIDRINTIIAVAPNPGIFVEVDKWVEKLDLPVKVTAGSVGNYVYRLKYGRSETIAMAIMALYTGNIYALIGMAAMANGGGVGAAGGAMGGMYGGMGGMGMGYGGMGMG
ncbi:MAG TPA: secretin N-terminal domain-containing protein, partial [Bryobacteraceae bacterium]|nr:secretin N-terminal domain-containing protein [Bryobacteraceae bacterium]